MKLILFIRLKSFLYGALAFGADYLIKTPNQLSYATYELILSK